MNKSEFIGRLTRDNEVSSSASGTTFLKNSIAVDRKFKREGEPTADFFNFTMFGKAAETFEKYTHKGSKVYLSGRMENNSYTKKDGTKANDTRLMVDDFEFLDGKSDAPAKEAKNDFLGVPDGLIEHLPFDDAELPFK